jgi:hypothetical protein
LSFGSLTCFSIKVKHLQKYKNIPKLRFYASLVYRSNSYATPLTYYYLEKNRNISLIYESLFSISISSLVLALFSGLAIPENDIYKLCFYFSVVLMLVSSSFMVLSLIKSSCLTSVVIIFLSTYFSISGSVACNIY